MHNAHNFALCAADASGGAKRGDDAGRLGAYSSRIVVDTKRRHPNASSTPTPSPSPAIADLGALVAPATEAELVGAFLKKERLFVVAGAPRRAERLLPLWMFDRLVSSDVLPASRLHVMREGDVVPAAELRGEDGRIRASALAALVAEGVSLVVNGIDADVPAIATLVGALERRLGHTVWANAYATYGPGGALPPHYDDHDVLVLQIYGSKRWFCHGTPTPYPIARSPDRVDFGPPRWDALVAAGDVLYLPRGEVHHTESPGGVALHVTFGIEPRRGVDVVAQIRDDAAEDPFFRQDVTRLGGPAALAERERELKTRLHALVDRIDLDAWLAADDEARPVRAPSRK